MPDLRALALIYDIRGFTAASKRLNTADLGSFATAAHRVILDLFAAHPPTFVKNLGDGHLLLWECSAGLEPGLVDGVVGGAQRARTAFAAFASARRAAGEDLPSRVGIGVAYGEVARSDDYYGRALNLASRLQGVARPEGLALDQDVFAAVTARNDALKSVFKRARVRLKGLGSTLVWVDRPFSWARVLAPVWKAALVLALPLVYLLLADAGLGVPGGEGVRRWLDGRGITLFRQVHPDAAVRVEADRLRRRLVDAIETVRPESGWMRNSFPRPPNPADQRPEMWSFSQATCALLKTPHLSRAEFHRALDPFRRWLFDPQGFVEVDGEPWGWLPRPRAVPKPGVATEAAYAEAEPTMWVCAALAVALQRPEYLEPAEREALRGELARAQTAAVGFRPLDTGAWNIFRDQTDPAYHSPYVTTLALLALLEANAAGEPWQGDKALRDRLLKSTAAFLLRTYQANAAPPGWRRTPDTADVVSPGLTTQVLTELLRAEAEAGVELPPTLVDGIPDHLVNRAAHQLADHYDMGEYQVEFISHEKDDKGLRKQVTRTESVNFLVHPWAVDCAQRWLDRAAKRGAPAADVVRVRRALGHMVVDVGNHAFTKATEGFLFVASETLYGLSRVPPPGPP